MDNTVKSPRRRWWWAAGAAIAVAIAATGYVVIEPLFAGCVDTSRPRAYAIGTLKPDPVAVSPSGEFIVGEDPKEFDRFVLWDDGEYSTVTIPDDEDFPEMYPVDVNDSGVVTGYFHEPQNDDSTPFRYDDGDFETLLAPGGTSRRGIPSAIDGDGAVVGEAESDEDDVTTRAVLWRAGETRASTLAFPDVIEVDTNGSAATDISEDGVVVGVAEGDAWIWESEGEGRRLASADRAPAIAGEWMLAGDRKWDLTRDGDGPTVVEADGEPGFNAVDRCGRVYGVTSDGEDAVLHDGELRTLPGFEESGQPPDPDDPHGGVRAASEDGSVLIGRSEGRNAVWTYE